ncbi:ABC transporter ATP-binding protein [Glycomyces salinus]|uniref:ABC transporter ATP-binding protein n=1 Tax=Glycomyces salinus TaxID=980294 RepID=UPI0018EBBE66|nr:ABC transporter ATP-binding protein [Glycomyces salinus]
MHSTPHTDPAVDIVDLTVGYETDKPVLDGFSSSFGRGALTLVRGENGSGKSTLVELCSGYLKPWRGEVRVAGRAASSPAARRNRRVCRTDPALYPHMTVRDHLVFAARCAGIDAGPGLARAERYGLGPWMDDDAGALSTGNRRKVWLTMCTLGDFEVAVLDEPFNGLDADGRDLLCDEMRAWSADAAVVLVAHAPPAALTPDRVLDLDGPGASIAKGD